MKVDHQAVLTEGLQLACTFGNQGRFKTTERSPETGTKSVPWGRSIISASPVKEVEKRKTSTISSQTDVLSSTQIQYYCIQPPHHPKTTNISPLKPSQLILMQ